MNVVVDGMAIQIDAADVHLLAATVWHVDSLGYVGGVLNGRRTRLHRAIMLAAPGQVVDHKSRDKTDYRRRNLRITDRSGNAQNAGLHRHNKSGFKGVYLCKASNRWRAEIRVRGVSIKLGRYRTREDAARAYDVAAVKHHGEFALTNADLGLLPPVRRQDEGQKRG